MAETSKIRAGALTEEEIEKLKATGWGLRVKKYGEDRIYFGAEQLGLKIKGNICSGDMYAELNAK